jgi:hypothetical protein
MKHPQGCVCSKDSKTRTKHYLPHLRSICRLRKTERGKFIHKCHPCVIKFIGDCCHALLKRYIKLPSESYKKLKKYQNDILYIARKKTSLRHKRARLIEKSGGFLPFLLPALASSLASIGTQLIGNLVNSS